MKYLIIIVIAFCFFACGTTMNYVSYSFVNYDNEDFSKNNLRMPRNKFINYDNYIFEFILRVKIDSYITPDQNKISENINFDTIGVIVHNLKSKTFTKIWPFHSSFKILEKDIAIQNKIEGFVTTFQKGSTDNSLIEKPVYKNKVIDGLKLKYTENQDSGYQTQVFYVNKNYFKSPYELYTDIRHETYCVIGYKITHITTSDSFGEIISDIKPIDSKTKSLCREIIEKINL